MKLLKVFFLGALIVVSVLSVLVKNYLNISIPVFKVIIGCMIVLFGLSIVSIITNFKTKTNFLLQSGVIKATQGIKEYNIIFSNGTIDLTQATLPAGKKIKVNVIFGKGSVVFNSKNTTKVKATSVFANTNLPDNKSINFGEYEYINNTSVPGLSIESNTVFGNTDIVGKAVNI